MKKIISVLVLALACYSAFASKIVSDSIYSEVLGAEVKYNVYLPTGYDASQHYPVIYLLHGLSDDYNSWVEKGRMDLVADELIRSGELLPTVFIMPNAGGPDVVNTWNGYFNMPGWNYEDFFFGELLPAAEAKYNAGGSKGQRAIMGLSMGGGGSAVYCQRHPEMFSSCYAMSPWLDNKGDEVGTPAEKNCLYYVSKAVRENSAVDFVRFADSATVEKMNTVKWFIDCGDDDFLLAYSTEIHFLMKEKGIAHELRVRDGVHNWEYWHVALRTALPFASRNFSK